MGQQRNRIPIWRQIPTVKDSSGAPRNARAVVVLIGWWGAKPRHLEKYATELWHGILPSAAIVAGTASSGSILFKKDAQLQAFAKQGLEAIASTLSEYENIHLPVVIHIFSNGGAYVWEQMLEFLEEKSEPSTLQFQQYFDRHRQRQPSVSSIDTEETPLHTNTAIAVLRQNIRGVIFDSAPVYPKFDNGMAALEGSGMVKNFILLNLCKVFFVLYFVLENMWLKVNGRQDRTILFWNRLRDSDWDIPQAFIYSAVDRMVDPGHLEDFIDARTKHLEQHDKVDMVSTLKFDNSPHVQHFRRHPDEYKEFVQRFVNEHVLRRAKKKR